jgi:predicted ester cyclase
MAVTFIATILVNLSKSPPPRRRYLGVMTDNKTIVRKLYEDVINTGRLDDLDAYISADFDGGGLETFRTNVATLLAGFPDIHFTVEDLIAEGDRVAARWTWVATHGGTFRGIAPTQRRVTNSGIVIYQLRDGRIVRNWLETDRLGALQQLEAAPQPR